ncbi:hypothetical protein AVEN_125022-1 [Araneus ventricosus]|uniref:Uncharacterized protein n=1 Tax=Araneus ventricosus TaxID=182803 RepID=A0A4Y2GZJ4_ARAVE|nr:hypothetical protein AVEN_125022-1 [Araneus ventricosus]
MQSPRQFRRGETLKRIIHDHTTTRRWFGGIPPFHVSPSIEVGHPQRLLQATLPMPYCTTSALPALELVSFPSPTGFAFLGFAFLRAYLPLPKISLQFYDLTLQMATNER